MKSGVNGKTGQLRNIQLQFKKFFFNDFLIFSPCPDARSLHCIDKEAAEATTLQNV